MKIFFQYIVTINLVLLLQQKDINAQTISRSDTIATALLQSFKTQDPQYLQPLLAKNFSIGVHNRPTADNMLQTVLKKYPLDSVSVAAGENNSQNNNIAFQFFDKGKLTNTKVWLNGQNEIIHIDLFDRLYGIDRYKKSTLQAVIPFQLIYGSIVIKATLNNNSKTLNLLFDTGADGMALNKAVADELGLTISRKQSTSVVGGNMQINISSGNTLHLDTINIPNSNIGIFEKVSDHFDGILGITLATHFITKVDFDKQVIELYSLGEYEFEKEGATIDIRMPTGIPVMPASIKAGNKEADGSFVFDTGANYYFISFSHFTKSKSLIALGFLPYYTGSTVSMGHSTTSITGNFLQLDIGKFQLQNFPGVLQVPDANTKDWESNEGGSIGIKTIKRFNFTINLVNHSIHFTPNTYSKLPFDFVVGGLYLSFDKEQHLFVERIVNKILEDKFEEGDIITSINGIKTTDLIKHPEKIESLMKLLPKKYAIKFTRNGDLMEGNF